MICISFSDKYVRFGQLIKHEDTFTIETVQKKTLTFPFTPANISDPKLASQLENIFQEIRSDLPIPDRYVAVSIPSEWVDIHSLTVDEGLATEDLNRILDWHAEKRLGGIIEKKFVQYYPLKSSDSEGTDFLMVSYFKEMGKLLLKVSQPAGFNIHILDVNIFSAAGAIERLEKPGKDKTWGIWQVGEDEHKLLVLAGGEFRQLVHFNLKDAADYSITQCSSPDEIGDQVVKEINKIRTFEGDSISTLDHLYYYSQQVESEFFNMLLTYDIDNMKILDPFALKKAEELYDGDGSGIGAMCQFIDLMGLIIRKLPEDAS